MGGTARVDVTLIDDAGTGWDQVGTTPGDDLAGPVQSLDITVASFPDVVTVTPRPTNTDGSPTTNVPTEIYLELGFSQPMDTVEVEKSILRLTQYNKPDDTTVSSAWDIHLATAQLMTGGYSADNGNIELSWHNTPRGANTLLKVESQGGAFSLNPETTYRMQIVDNQAKAEGSNGLPLFLGGEIDLSSGYQFTTTGNNYQYPRIVTMTPRPPATVDGTTMDVPTEVHLEIGFSEEMDTVEVEKSTLRLTQYEPEPYQTTVKSFWDIHLATAQLITGG